MFTHLFLWIFLESVYNRLFGKWEIQEIPSKTNSIEIELLKVNNASRAGINTPKARALLLKSGLCLFDKSVFFTRENLFKKDKAGKFGQMHSSKFKQFYGVN